MSVIVWSEQLSVGIESIDEQHKVLIGMINSLNTAMAQGEANMMIGDILMGLTAYTRHHFSYEEELFGQYEYPNSIEHKRQHSELIEQISALKDQFELDLSGSIGLEIMQFLKNWLTNHIMKTDKAYSEYLIAKGVK
jgi:hemerythrin